MIFLLMTPAVRAEDRVEQAESLLRKFCFACHDTETREADVDLSTFANKQSFFKDRRVWQRTVEMLEASAMPPEGHRQPTRTERAELITSIRTSLNHVDWAAVRAPGRVPLVRMTRDEFKFAVEDLFGIHVDLEKILPAEPEGLSGFSNDHASLVMTTQQLTRYLKAAEIVTATVVDQAFESPFVIHYEVEDGTNASWQKNVEKESDGSRGWAFSSKLGNKYQAVSKAFDFERTGRYRIRMRARSKGPGKHAAAWIAVDSVNDASKEAGMLVVGKEFATYETDMFVTKGRHTIIFGYDFYGPLWLPKAPERAQLKLGQSTFDPPPYDRTELIPSGLTVADLTAEGLHVSDDDPRAIELIRVINDGYFVAVLDNLMLHKFHYEKGYLPVFLGGLGYNYQETVVPAFKELAEIAGTDQKHVVKIWESRHPESYKELERFANLQRESWAKQDQHRKQQVGDLFVDWIEMAATKHDPDVPRSREDLSPYLDRVLPRALRRRIDEADRNRFLTIYEGERARGVEHRAALQRMLVAILVSPEFLYRTDGPAVATGVSRLEGHPLASRLASFLWSSLPDQQLLGAASANTLSTDKEINIQVDRMLDHDRRQRFSALFTEQWLNLSDIGRGKEPDKELFRYFSWRLAQDMREEVARLFDGVLRDDRSILELLDSKEAIVNERLARLYGLEGVTGAEFRAVKLTDERRGGLLGTAAVLTSTSLAMRTSPVRRGQFVLETILGVDLPSPPADVPQLNENAGQSRELSLRESLARHRQDTKCSGCHNKIDPLGFALENFDWIGRWREHDAAGPVDSNGRLPDGRTLSGVQDLKMHLVSERRDEFTTALTKAVLKFALGRDLEYFDEDAVRNIVSEVQMDQYRMRTMIKAIARSYPFRFREIKETN